MSDAEAAAAKGNRSVKQKTDNAKSKLRDARALYPNAKNDADNDIKSLSNLLSKAPELDQKAEIEVLPNKGSPNDYTKVSKSASTVKTQAEALEKEIKNAKKKLLRAAKAIVWVMPATKEKDLIEKHKADGVATASGFDKMFNDAESAIQRIEQKRDAVSAAVEAIRKFVQNNPQKVTPRINGFLATAQSDLKTISQKINEVYKAKQTVLSRRQHVEDSKEELNEAAGETVARRELRNIKLYDSSAEVALEKIKKALKSADAFVLSASNRKHSAKNELLKNNGRLNGEADKVTEKPTKIIKDSAAIPTKQEAERQTQNKKEESKEEATIISTSQEAQRQADQKEEKPVEETTAKPTNKEVVRPTVQSQDEPVEETVEKNPVNKGTMLTSAASDDSTITMTTSLLLGFVVCAAMHG